jgi:hypothetical protein
LNTTPWTSMGSGDITPPFLTLAQDGSEWSALCSSHFTSRETAPSTKWTANYVKYCTMFVVGNPSTTPNVQCLRYFTTLHYVYAICHFWTPICNVLGYRRQHSICYTCLFMTPLVVTTISGYIVLWPSDVVSRGGPLISSLLFVRWSLFSVFISVSLLPLSVVFSHLSLFLSQFLFYICRPSNTVFASGIEDTFSHGCTFCCFSFTTIWLLTKLNS